MRGRYAAKRQARALRLPALEWAWACSGNGGGGHVPYIDRLVRWDAFNADEPFKDAICVLCHRPITRNPLSADREGSWHVPLLIIQELP